MADKLDILLGRAAPDPAPDTWIEKALLQLAEGNNRGRGVIDEISELPIEARQRLAHADLDRLYKSVGPAATERMREDLRKAGNKRIADLDAEARRIEKEMVVLRCARTHNNGLKEMLRGGTIVFKTRPFIPGNARLRAHEVVEQINSDRRGLLDTKDGVKSLLNRRKEEFISLHRLVVSSAKFDIRSIEAADIEPNAGFSRELEADGLLVLPFPVCWFEWDVEPDCTVGGIIQERAGGGLEFSGLVRVAGAGWGDWAHSDLAAISDHIELVCRAALVLLNSRNADKTEIQPSDRLNRRREKGGAHPLFSHTVIEIRGVAVDRRGNVTRQTHRSPRMHWRRGHLRRFRRPNGEVYRVTPIAPMLVGRAELGRIEHSYLMAPQTAHNVN